MRRFFFFCFFIGLGINALLGQPVTQNGLLKVSGNKVVNSSGQSVSFAGNSFFWTNTGWGGEKFYNSSVVNFLKNDWNSSIVRASMGINENGGYISDAASNKARVKAIVDAAISAGIYVIIDWHCHTAQDYQSQAVSFFSEMAGTYGNSPNVMYEIYNEPLQVSWSSVIKPYANAVIAAIRAKDPDNIIIVGTPSWSQDVDVAANDPITGYSNIAYTCHFYAGTHKQYLRDKITTAMSKGIAIVVTEWGTCDASGDGGYDVASTNEWMTFLKNNGISHCNWAVNDKAETASILNSGASSTGGWSDANLTQSGLLVRNIIRNWSPVTTTYTISASAGTGGTISPSGSVKVNKGASQTFSIAASSNYKINDVTINGSSVGAVGSYTFSNVTANQTIAATFTPTTVVTYPVPGKIEAENYSSMYGIQTETTTDAGGGLNVGWIDANDWMLYKVNVATTGAYKVEYRVASFNGGGAIQLDKGAGTASYGSISVPSTGGWQNWTTISHNVTLAAGVQDLRILATSAGFNVNWIQLSSVNTTTYTITASAGANGSISPSGAVVVNSGSGKTFSITAASGYKISDVKVNGNSVGAVGTYTFNNVSADQTIAASFVVDNNPCDLLTRFAVPRSSALPTLANNSYSHSYTLGTGGPSLSNITSFSINWDLPNKGLYQLSMNTNNGVPSWWIDLLPKISQTFASSSPACTLTGTGISGLDGNYWAAIDGANFVMVAKSGAYALYFTSGTAPSCTKSAIISELDNVSRKSIIKDPISVNGERVTVNLSLEENTDVTISAYNMVGKIALKKSLGKYSAGEHTIQLETGISVGVYVLEIKAGNLVKRVKARIQ